jgi:hypothetical protein
LDDHALLDTVGNEGSDEDDNATQAFVWENMENCTWQRENFTGGVGPQGAAKHVMEIVEVFELFSSKELTDTIVKETDTRSSSYATVNYQSVRLETCDRRRNLYCIGFVYAYGHYLETYSQVVFYQNSDHGGYADIIT